MQKTLRAKKNRFPCAQCNECTVESADWVESITVYPILQIGDKETIEYRAFVSRVE